MMKYAILLALVTLLAVTGAQLVGTQIKKSVTDTSDAVRYEEHEQPVQLKK